jgi:hypothetical protein
MAEQRSSCRSVKPRCWSQLHWPKDGACHLGAAHEARGIQSSGCSRGVGQGRPKVVGDEVGRRKVWHKRRRDGSENQGFGVCHEHAVGDMDPIRELPYGPAASGAASEAGQMAASDTCNPSKYRFSLAGRPQIGSGLAAYIMFLAKGDITLPAVHEAPIAGHQRVRRRHLIAVPTRYRQPHRPGASPAPAAPWIEAVAG